MERDSFIFYRSFYDSIKTLEPIIFYEIIKAIIEYALNGESYSGSNTTVNMVFTLIKPQIDANNKKYTNGKKGGRPNKNEKPEVTNKKTTGFSDEEPNENNNINDNENRNENVNEAENTNVNDSTHPSLSDIEAYINEHNYKEFDCNKFFYHYQSKNWLINGQPITNWQALIEKWISQDATNKKKSSNGKSSSFKGRDYDFEQLENELLSN